MAARNKTMAMTDAEIARYEATLLTLSKSAKLPDVRNRILHQDMIEAAALLPDACVDLLFLDPPYNMNKKFNGSSFYKQSANDYSKQLDGWVAALIHTLKPTATIYICGDWLSSASIYEVAGNYFKIRNRITWEREKGRGALSNWKNCSEDIWFCTMGDDYHFDTEAVKLKRKVLAPYRHVDDSPNDLSFQPVDGHHHSFLVNARKHRTSHAKT